VISWFCILLGVIRMSEPNGLPKGSVKDRKFVTLKEFHGCMHLLQFSENSFARCARGGGARDCWVDVAIKLKECLHYDGPLLEAVKKAREEKPYSRAK